MWSPQQPWSDTGVEILVLSFVFVGSSVKNCEFCKIICSDLCSCLGFSATLQLWTDPLDAVCPKSLNIVVWFQFFFIWNSVNVSCQASTEVSYNVVTFTLTIVQLWDSSYPEFFPSCLTFSGCSPSAYSLSVYNSILSVYSLWISADDDENHEVSPACFPSPNRITALLWLRKEEALATKIYGTFSSIYRALTDNFYLAASHF